MRFWELWELFRAYTADEEPRIMSEPTKTFTYNSKVAAIHKLRVNIKSLTAEAKIIRQESRRAGPGYRESLVLHRRGRLREEARYTHLALAYLRGRTHKQAEGGCKLDLDVPKLLDKLKRSGANPELYAVHTWVGNTSESK
jgi:hypothetical protein